MRRCYPRRLFCCSILASVLMFVILSGCTILPHREPVTLYQLPAAKIATTLPTALNTAQETTLCLADPQSTGMLAGNRIVVIQDNSLSTYPSSRWSVPAPLLWRDYLVDAFKQDGRISHLCTENESVLTDYVLNSTLRAFHYQHDAKSPRVTITMDLRLVSTKNQRIIASQQFTVHEPLADPLIDGIVLAFGRAGNRLAQTIIQWTLVELLETPTSAANHFSARVTKTQ